MTSAKNKPVVGKSVADIATMWKVDGSEALARLLEEENGSVSYIGHAMSPENVELVLSHPLWS